MSQLALAIVQTLRGTGFSYHFKKTTFHLFVKDFLYALHCYHLLLHAEHPQVAKASGTRWQSTLQEERRWQSALLGETRWQSPLQEETRW